MGNTCAGKSNKETGEHTELQDKGGAKTMEALEENKSRQELKDGVCWDVFVQHCAKVRGETRQYTLKSKLKVVHLAANKRGLNRLNFLRRL